MTATLNLMHGLTLTEDGRTWGEMAVARQREDAAAVLSPDGPRRHWIGRPRGFSKTGDVAAMLRLLELVREHRLAFPMDDDLVDEMVALRLIESSPGVFRHDHDRMKHDDQVTAISLVTQHYSEHGQSVPPNPWSSRNTPHRASTMGVSPSRRND